MALGSSVEHTPCSARKLPSVVESIGEVELDQYRAKAAEDMANCAIHADTITEFLDELLPWPLDADIPSRLPLDENPFKVLENADDLTEDVVTDLLASIIVKYNLAPGLKLCRSEHLADSKDIDKTGQKIDAAFFRAADAPDDGRPHWALQLLAIEFKSRLEGRNHNDPYDDTLKDGSADATADSRARVRGQTTTYSELIHAIQHRTALFMLIVIGRKFRVTRWDRAGTIVTNAIDYYEHPDALCDFLWRVAHLSDEALGLDPSAVRLHEKDASYRTMDFRASPSSTDVDCTERVLGEKELANVDMNSVTFSYVRKLFADSISGDWPRYKLRIPDGDEQRWLYVGKPLFIAPGMAGRGTKGWVGLDAKRNCFMFIKDSWRAAYEELEKEGDILLKLNHAEVPNVPTLVCHGDIDEQTTRTAQWWVDKNPVRKQGLPKSQSVVGRMKRKREPGTPLELPATDPAHKEVPEYAHSVSFRYDCPIRIHTHYRMVLAEVCLPLKEFASGKQLVTALHDVVGAHHCAATHPDLKILHRDIGGGNILLYPRVVVENEVRSLRWRGILIDWEVSRPLVAEGTASIPRQPERTGSWQFTSANILNNPSAPVKTADELESILHVLVYYAVRYLRSNASPDEVATFLDEYFDCYTVRSETKRITCGEKKSLTVRMNGELRFQRDHGHVRLLFQSPLDGLVPWILARFKGHYKVMDYAAASKGKKPWMLPAPAWTSTAPAKPALSPDTVDDSSESEDDDDDDTISWDQVRKPEIDRPNERDKKFSEVLSAHTSMLSWLDQAARRTDWSKEDKTGDRVPQGWKSHHLPIPPGVSTRNRTAAASQIDVKLGVSDVAGGSRKKRARREG